MKYLLLFFVSITLLLTACGGAESSEPSAPTQVAQPTKVQSEVDTPVPTNTTIPESTPTELPATETLPTETAVAPPAEPPTPTPPLLAATETAIEVVSGQLPDGAFFLGDVNAPLTVIDYSDFL